MWPSQVAKATTVDSTRRKRAADQIATLSGGGLDVSELPSMKEPSKAARPPPAPGDEDAEHRPAAVAGKPKKAAAPATEDDDPYAEVGAQPAPAPAPAPKPASGTTTDKATSGDRSAQIAAKDALKAKVNSGRGTDRDKRLLRALCRQYNDPSCAN